MSRSSRFSEAEPETQPALVTEDARVSAVKKRTLSDVCSSDSTTVDSRFPAHRRSAHHSAVRSPKHSAVHGHGSEELGGELDSLDAFMKQIEAAESKGTTKKRRKVGRRKVRSQQKDKSRQLGERLDLATVDTMEALNEQLSDKRSMFIPGSVASQCSSERDEICALAAFSKQFDGIAQLSDGDDEDAAALKHERSDLDAISAKLTSSDSKQGSSSKKIMDESSKLRKHKSSRKSAKKGGIILPEFVGELVRERVDVYNEHFEVTLMTKRQSAELRSTLKIDARGHRIPKAVSSFAHMGLCAQSVAVMAAKQFTRPSAVQCQGVCALLSGRDLLALANTGSGKTETYIWPMLEHVIYRLKQAAVMQKTAKLAMALKKIILSEVSDESPENALIRAECIQTQPMTLVLCPTRELCDQSVRMLAPYCKAHGSGQQIRFVALHGSANMHKQKRALSRGVQIVVSTPGRLLDLLNGGNIGTLRNVSMLVVDECDRMFNLGFEKQISAILAQTPSTAFRQTVMISATLNSKVEGLAKAALCSEPIRLIVGGSIGAVDTERIAQGAVVLANQGPAKEQWLRTALPRFIQQFPDACVLIFCGSKKRCDACARVVSMLEIAVGVIHGDKLQTERSRVIAACQAVECRVLVATDVASRGLDVASLRTVINYDCAVNVDAHVHRIGRVGRQSQTHRGMAITLIAKGNSRDYKFAPKLLKHFELLKMQVPESLKAFVLGAKKEKEKTKGTEAGDYIRGRGAAARAQKQDAVASFHKDGFVTGDVQRIRSSFASTFTKASDESTGKQ